MERGNELLATTIGNLVMQLSGLQAQLEAVAAERDALKDKLAETEAKDGE